MRDAERELVEAMYEAVMACVRNCNEVDDMYAGVLVENLALKYGRWAEQWRKRAQEEG